jgi:hypothetical protein
MAVGLQAVVAVDPVFDFLQVHLSSSPVSVLRQRLADVCMLSGRGIKVNRFSGKDMEVFLGLGVALVFPRLKFCP